MEVAPAEVLKWVTQGAVTATTAFVVERMLRWMTK